MHILGAGRDAFLGFLRNLTPTVLLTGACLFLWARLDFTRIDLSNWLLTLAFYCCSATVALSTYANISAFLDTAFGPSFDYKRAIRRLDKRGHRLPRLLAALPTLAWRNRRALFAEWVLALIVIYAALFGLVVAALSAAVTALKNGLH